MNKYIILLLFAVGCGQQAELDQPISVRVAVLNFDPAVGDSTLHSRFGWADPRALADQYIDALSEVSHNRVSIDIVSWKDESRFPIKTDGFEYSLDEFESCWEDRSTCHDPDGTDYERLIQEYDIVSQIDSDQVDEVWIFGAPYMGFWESSMAGPGAFYINGGVFESVPSTKPFAIMGFSYERGVAEMLHNLCHRTEATMEKVSGGWDTMDLSTDWARFAANAHQSGGVAAVGSCHYPPNGTEDYDYYNQAMVASNAEAWLDYPEVSQKTDSVNAETWGVPNYQLNYMKWWFSHLPHADLQPEGDMLGNWWNYVYRFQDHVLGL